MHRILVTGSSGQLGSEIVNQLKKLPCDVRGVDKSPASTTDEIVDITSKSQCLQTIKDTDTIIHTAAIHGRHYELGYTRTTFLDVNVQGTLNLLEAGVASGVKKFIYTSTTSVYGNAMVHPDHAVWVTENLMPQPRDIYDISKLSAEAMCRDFALKEGINVIVLRIGRFYTENERLMAINRLYRGLSVSDGAKAHVLAMKSNLKGFKLYNLSCNSPFQICDLRLLMNDPKTVMLKYHPELKLQFEKRNWQFPEKIDRVYVIDKIKSELGFTPKDGILSLF